MEIQSQWGKRMNKCEKKLVIFDCDGVLVDSELIAHRVANESAASLGFPPMTAEESFTV